MNNKSVVDKIYLYAKHPFAAKYQNLIKKRQNVGLKHYDDPKPLIEYSSDMQGFHKNIEKYNPEKKPNVLIVFDEKIADMINNKKKLNPIVTELFIRGRNLNILIAFITQSYFKLKKEVRPNTTHFFYCKDSKQKRTSANCNESIIRC